MNLRASSLLAVCFFAPTAALADETVDLLAGQFSDVGDVTISDADGVLTVSIDTSASMSTIGVSHVYVGLEDPRKHAPGRFPYAHEDLGGAYTDSYTIDLADVGATCGDTIVVAVHTEVDEFLGYEDADVAGFNAALPTSVEFSAVQVGGNTSYWDLSVSDSTGVLDNDYDGWCIDTDRALGSNTVYTADVVSSLDDSVDFSELVEQPDNIDLLNYIINQDYLGQTCAADGRSYTMGDMQRAIWGLIDDEVVPWGLGTWSQACADEIAADAMANGEGYQPACDEEVAVLLVPRDAAGAISHQIVIAQVGFIEAGLECSAIVSGETGWAEGDRSFHQGWGMMIDYTTSECSGSVAP